MQKITLETVKVLKDIAEEPMRQDIWNISNMDQYIAYVTLKEFDFIWKQLPKLLEESSEWKQKNEAGAFEQFLGKYEDCDNVFTLSYYYIQPGTAFELHNHQGKVREWYIFLYAGKIEMCNRGEKHAMVNNLKKPDYVLSIKQAEK